MQPCQRHWCDLGDDKKCFPFFPFKARLPKLKLLLKAAVGKGWERWLVENSEVSVFSSLGESEAG